jgi:hypothetical protein
MADLSDVETAIVTLVSSLVYPNGSGQPSAVLNDLNAPLPVKIFRGWPVPATLDSDLSAGTANISIYPRGTGRNTTRYTPDFETITIPAATVNALAAGNQITITGGGSSAVAQYVSVNIGGKVGVSYAVVQSDTAASIATALAALITPTFTATANGAVVTVSSGVTLSVNVGVQVGQLEEVGRETEQIQITLWCPTPLTRDNLAKAVQPTLRNTMFLTMPDTSAARFRYCNTHVSDEKQTTQLYRRDLIYDVEFATTVADTADQVTLVQVNNGSNTSIYSQPVALPSSGFNATPSNF